MRLNQGNQFNIRKHRFTFQLRPLLVVNQPLKKKQFLHLWRTNDSETHFMKLLKWFDELREVSCVSSTQGMITTSSLALCLPHLLYQFSCPWLLFVRIIYSDSLGTEFHRSCFVIPESTSMRAHCQRFLGNWSLSCQEVLSSIAKRRAQICWTPWVN